MQDRIIKFLGHKREIPAYLPEIIQYLGLSDAQERDLQRNLRDLESRGLVVRLKGGRFLSRQSPALVSGRIQITKSGRGFVTTDAPGIPEIQIAARETATALHDDQVLVLLEPAPKRGWIFSKREPVATGSVVQVLERRRTRFVGTVRALGRNLHVTPDDPRFPGSIDVLQSRRPGCEARPGQKVVIELVRWESSHSYPKGKIIEVLGAADGKGVDMLAVLRQYNLTSDFPAAVLKEARRFGRSVTAADLKGRRDCRSHQVVTIDPDDARDFDDAICLEQAGANRWKLWVHIADVSHYVRPGTALDREASRRGNSTYLVDRVIPMLPEELSNELCSLKPQVDRLTKCVEFLLTSEGKVLRAEFYPAVIHSRRRLTYAQALAALEGAPADGIEEMLHQASQLAQVIRRRRIEAGSLDFDFPATKIRLNSQGRVDRIELHENDQSHQLIEEFMLLANEAVAGRLTKLKRPALYRAHVAPDPARLEDYRDEVRSHSIPCGNLTKPGEVQKLFRRLSGLAIGAALKIGFLKSLTRARYTAQPLGHFGLAKKNYTHFTSPIRRYADLVVHRSLFTAAGDPYSQPLRDMADYLSVAERNSADAERDSKDVKLHAFLLDQIQAGKPARYSAQVTKLNHMGIFVDIASLGMSGLLPFSLLKKAPSRHGGAYSRNPGSGSRPAFQLGDVIEVEVAKVDAARKMVDFRIAGTGGRPNRVRPQANDRKVRPSVQKTRQFV